MILRGVKRHVVKFLPVNHEKDWDMVMLLDDRARQVETRHRPGLLPSPSEI